MASASPSVSGSKRGHDDSCEAPSNPQIPLAKKQQRDMVISSSGEMENTNASRMDVMNKDAVASSFSKPSDTFTVTTATPTTDSAVAGGGASGKSVASSAKPKVANPPEAKGLNTVWKVCTIPHHTTTDPYRTILQTVQAHGPIKYIDITNWNTDEDYYGGRDSYAGRVVVAYKTAEAMEPLKKADDKSKHDCWKEIGDRIGKSYSYKIYKSAAVAKASTESTKANEAGMARYGAVYTTLTEANAFARDLAKKTFEATEFLELVDDAGCVMLFPTNTDSSISLTPTNLRAIPIVWVSRTDRPPLQPHWTNQMVYIPMQVCWEKGIHFGPTGHEFIGVFSSLESANMAVEARKMSLWEEIEVEEREGGVEEVFTYRKGYERPLIVMRIGRIMT